jgi:hypothetical protein
MTLQDAGDLMATKTNIWFQICVTWRHGLTQVDALVVPSLTELAVRGDTTTAYGELDPLHLRPPSPYDLTNERRPRKF